MTKDKFNNDYNAAHLDQAMKYSAQKFGRICRLIEFIELFSGSPLW